jgi:hypothetical protein
MPLYSTFCPGCRRKGSFYARIEGRNSVPKCTCGEIPERVVDMPFVSPDIPAYISPNGKLVSSRRERKEDLLRSGAYEWEPGIERDISRRKEAAIQESFQPIADAVDSTVRDLAVCGKLESLNA